MKLIAASLFASIIFFNMSPIDKSGNNHPADQSSKPLFSFGIIADVQYCNCEPEGTRFYSKSLNKLREALGSLKEDSVEFLINLGDLIDRNYESFRPVLDIIDSSGIKTYHLTGNHDYSVEDRYKKRIPLPQPSKEGYYSFIYKDFRFIALNGNEVSTYASGSKIITEQAEKFISALKDSGNINAIDWNGGLGRKQLEWLKSQLDESTSQNEKVIILCHFPAYPNDTHNLLNCNEVLLILKNYHNVIAWFSGHNHAGNYGNFNMIHFVTLKGMVETENSGSFARVEMYRNKIWITGSGREKSQILSY